MRCHKWIMEINTVKIAKRFACANEQLRAFWVGVCVWLSGRWAPWLPPSPSPRFITLRRLCVITINSKFFLWLYWLEPISWPEILQRKYPVPFGSVMSCFRALPSLPPPLPCAVHGRLQTWPQSMRNWSKQLGRCCEWSCCRRRVNWKEGIEKTNVRRHQRAEERRARRKNSSALP